MTWKSPVIPVLLTPHYLYKLVSYILSLVGFRFHVFDKVDNLLSNWIPLNVSLSKYICVKRLRCCTGGSPQSSIKETAHPLSLLLKALSPPPCYVTLQLNWALKASGIITGDFSLSVMCHSAAAATAAASHWIIDELKNVWMSIH